MLISSLPLPNLVKYLVNVPNKILEYAKHLKWTSGILLSLGFNKKNIPKHLWFYIYNKNILASRIYSPSLKSLNNAPKNKSSLQSEIYYSKEKPLNKPLEEIVEKEISSYHNSGFFDEKDIILKDVRKEEFANIIFDHNIYYYRKRIIDYINSLQIKLIGRFGEWKYFWSDQSLLSGKKVSEEIYNEYFKG